jgi:pyruvate,orthophosphate dikinase
MLVDIRNVPPDQLSAEFLGGKGHGLAWMASHGINVPPALVIPTTVCAQYRQAPKKTMAAIKKLLPEIRLHFQKELGYMPLLSVRSGARVSMPGMMDTILNVGLDPKTLPFWQDKVGNNCAENCLQRLVQMYVRVVVGDADYEPTGLDPLGGFQELFERAFPDTNGQILDCIEAVFKSWDNERAKTYRKMHNIPNDWGTAVVLQAMVFGNMGDDSGTGVLFSRNPDTGENVVVGEYLMNAQGEDVVDGSHTPLPLKKMKSMYRTQLEAIAKQLETLRCDVQDVEFTIQQGTIFILQTRSAKRSAVAALRIALDLHPGPEAFHFVSYQTYVAAQADQIDPNFGEKPWGTGLGACNGVVTGQVVLTAQDAVAASGPVILVTKETTPDDIAGMAAARGILTMNGGTTSHAAVVARAMNRVAVVGLGKKLSSFKAGETISIDGSTGRVWKKAVPVIPGDQQPAVKEMQQRLVQASGCFLADDLDADLLDLSAVPLDQVGGRVSQALATRDRVVVDFLPALDNTAGQVWAGMFGQPSLGDKVEKALMDLTDEQCYRVSVMVPDGVYTGRPVQLIASLDNLANLVTVNGPYIWGSAQTEAVQKVQAWLAAEGKTPLSLGVVKPGGYVGHHQLAQELLK